MIGWLGRSYVIDVALSHKCGAAIEGKGGEGQSQVPAPFFEFAFSVLL
jgi:hypothetical protein